MNILCSERQCLSHVISWLVFFLVKVNQNALMLLNMLDEDYPQRGLQRAFHMDQANCITTAYFLKGT